MDETLDGPSDADGVESLIDILHKMNANDNIFIISHRGQQFSEKFDDHIRFEKIKNFTQIAAWSWQIWHFVLSLNKYITIRGTYVVILYICWTQW